MEKVYRLTPTLQDNLWGGNRLRGYGKTSEKDRIAESWELSFVPGNEARIDDGRTTTEAFPRETWGKNCEKFEFFPVLTKFIDAKEKLSVQVHPDDEYALKNEGQYGKTEMWYVVDREGEDAGLYMGLNGAYTKDEFSRAVADGTVERLLGRVDVEPGDVWFIPSRTVHAILGGDLIFEIQQNSTLTYRLYDYMRRDKDGNLRPLHVEKAMAVTDLDVYKPQNFESEDGSLIGKCDYFETHIYKLNFTKMPISASENSFISVTVVRGCGKVGELSAKAGDSFFIPAGAGEVILSGDENFDVITVSVP
ncbi:MAG: class I mannose-6-phosphate isomerase [Clostridia bacterium]|nr:class I mannose-6-phosphate isomerase [Clostridia bacterium]